MIRTLSAVLVAMLPLVAVAGDFEGLSFTGDGSSPSGLSLFNNCEKSAQGARYATSASEKGDASYGIGIQLPPALLSPSVALSYSSAAGAHSFVGRGWSIDAGMTIS